MSLHPSFPLLLALVAAPLFTAQGADFTQAWPGALVNAGGLPSPRVLAEDDSQGVSLYETEHFRFICSTRVELAAICGIAHLFESTCFACQSLPLNFPCDRVEEEAPTSKYEVCLLRTQEEFLRIVGPQYKGVPGVYMSGRILLPYECVALTLEKDGRYSRPWERRVDTDTLIHEITHQMTLRGATWDTPTWFGEGIAEYLRLAADGKGTFDFAGMKDAIAPYVITGRRLGNELTAPPLEQFMNLSRMEFQQARGRDGHFNYAFSTLLTYYFIHLDGEGDAASLKRWMQHLQTTPKATAHLRYNLPEPHTPEQRAAERKRLMQEVLSIREIYYYEHLLAGRSWQELEDEISRKVEAALGIRIIFSPTTP